MFNLTKLVIHSMQKVDCHCDSKYGYNVVKKSIESSSHKNKNMHHLLSEICIKYSDIKCPSIT